MGKRGNMINLQPGDRAATGYLALPTSGTGPGVLVLHAWWGLTDTFTQVCDRLADTGFVAFAPDLYRGAQATTIEEARALSSHLDADETRATVTGAVADLRAHVAVRGDGVGVVGFSMGGSWALLLSALMPREIAAVVTFYGTEEADYAAARAAFLGHFGERDEWEPADAVRALEGQLRDAGRDVTVYLYPEAGHWFAEQDRPAVYDADAAHLAWERTVAFLRHALVEA